MEVEPRWESDPKPLKLPELPERHMVWCVGGFLFPAAILVIWLAFHRQHPASEADLALSTVHPDTLSKLIRGLVLAHVVTAFLAVVRWHARGKVWVVTAVQLFLTLCTAFMAQMAVQGTWL